MIGSIALEAELGEAMRSRGWQKVEEEVRFASKAVEVEDPQQVTEPQVKTLPQGRCEGGVSSIVECDGLGPPLAVAAGRDIGCALHQSLREDQKTSCQRVAAETSDHQGDGENASGLCNHLDER